MENWRNLRSFRGVLPHLRTGFVSEWFLPSFSFCFLSFFLFLFLPFHVSSERRELTTGRSDCGYTPPHRSSNCGSIGGYLIRPVLIYPRPEIQSWALIRFWRNSSIYFLLRTLHCLCWLPDCSPLQNLGKRSVLSFIKHEFADGPVRKSQRRQRHLDAQTNQQPCSFLLGSTFIPGHAATPQELCLIERLIKRIVISYIRQGWLN